MHYQSTYYHFYIHIVHIALKANVTQATRKAIELKSIILQLEIIIGDNEVDINSIILTYTINETNDL